jgi:hypothetical protein
MSDNLNIKPPFRRLRGYAFDPSLSLRIDTALINSIIYQVPWEEGLKPGPIGEYIEVVDYDPTTGKYYKPVDLNNINIVARDGVDPGENNPQFHQQMVYAVAMTTIKNFESALGRKVLWASQRVTDKHIYEEYVQRIRLYPHALRHANAYYSPLKKSILFGYFESMPANSTLHMPNSYVFTCLSHDIITHEVTHAILDGMYPGYAQPSNADVLAFHEAFSDIVALFQHFTFPEVLKHQISKTRGDLAAQNLLGELAQEFGSAIGNYGSLRDAIGSIDPVTKKWVKAEPTGQEYATIMEPHARGSILVSAVFEAFLTIYKTRVKDLLRIATGGTGVLPQGELHPDLVNRLASEASKAAGHVLSMCMRALDYCPPVDITFGDYLRAVITADYDLVVEDSRNYRLAFIDAFRRRGIYPKGIKTFSVESMGLSPGSFVSDDTKQLFKIIVRFLRDYRNKVIYETDRKKVYNISKEYIGGSRAFLKRKVQGLHNRITFKFEDSFEFEQLTGLIFSDVFRNLGIRESNAYKDGLAGASFQIQNLRLVSRVGPEGNQVNQIGFALVQRSGIVIYQGKFKEHYTPGSNRNRPKTQFEMYGGCTMIFDLDTLELKYVISKPLLDMSLIKQKKHQIDRERAEQQYQFQQEAGMMELNEHSLYFSGGLKNDINEPFAFLHQ